MKEVFILFLSFYYFLRKIFTKMYFVIQMFEKFPKNQFLWVYFFIFYPGLNSIFASGIEICRGFCQKIVESDFRVESYPNLN